MIIVSGTIQPESYDTLEKDEWGEFIKDHLHHSDLIRMTRTCRMMHRDFCDLVDLLPHLRMPMYKGIEWSLDDSYTRLVRKLEEWHPEALDELLMMVNSLTTKSRLSLENRLITPYQQIQRYLDVIEPKPEELMKSEGIELYSRTLQLLAALRAPLPPTFWTEQLSIAPGKYGCICFIGCARVDPYAAIDLLDQIDWSDPYTQDRFGNYLFTFLQENEDSAVRSYLVARKSALHGGVQRLLEEENGF